MPEVSHLGLHLTAALTPWPLADGIDQPTRLHLPVHDGVGAFQHLEALVSVTLQARPHSRTLHQPVDQDRFRHPETTHEQIVETAPPEVDRIDARHRLQRLL